MTNNGFKPPGMKNYFTVAELCMEVGRSRSRIIRLEAEGKIPTARRYELGEISIRLWSPRQVKEIKRLLRTTIRPGRPPSE